jgi:glyoxylase-like metal-dependent hydrolase (beta-lactamase superfamily II)
MEQISPRVYQLGGRWGTGAWGANVFLLLGESLTLIDTGFKGRAAHILKEVERLGYSRFDVDSIIITHHHVDHVGSLAALKKAAKAKVVAHPADAPYIDGRLPQPGPARLRWLSKVMAPLRRLWAAAPAAVDILVNDGDEIPALGGIKVLHTPGHTPGSICLFLQQEGIVIVGDVITHRFGLSLPSKMFTVDMTQELQSIKRVVSLDFDVICFGHGSPIVYEAHPAITDFVETLQSKYQ